MAWLRNSCSQQHLPTFLTSPCFFHLSLTPFPVLTLHSWKQTRGGKASVRPSPLELSLNFSDTTCFRPWVKMSKIILEHWSKLFRLYLRSKLNYHGRQYSNKCSGASLKWVLMNIVLTSNEQKIYFWPKLKTLSHVRLWKRKVKQNVFLYLIFLMNCLFQDSKIVKIEFFCLLKKFFF